MSGAADTLRAWGILRADDVVTLARSAGLDLAAAAALLEQESGGGRNVWGSDPVPTGSAYTPGGEVTQHDYAAYRLALASGTAGPQGVGPCQLTWRGYQDQADRLGGCWSPVPNMRVGFDTLAHLVAAHGVRDGFRRYNGSGPAADRYADQTMAKLGRWRDRLGPAASTPTTTTTTAFPALLEDDMTPEETAALFEVRDNLRKLKPGVLLPGRSAGLANTLDDHFGWSMTGAGRADDALVEVRALRAELGQITAPAPPAIDYGALARALVAELGGKGGA